jgi:serine/threonine protein kinase
VKQLNESNVTDKAYEVELNALELARRLDHPHLVKFIAGFEQEQRRYLMFRWVDGRDLETFWKTQKCEPGEKIIRWALEQSKGLAEGLEKLHNFDLQRNCRHGDLKPNNIVRSLKPGEFGHLQIADMGLAKVHSLPTSLRRVGTTSLEGAIRYQPPEVKTSISGKRSRHTTFGLWDACYSNSLSGFSLGRGAGTNLMLPSKAPFSLFTKTVLFNPASTNGSSISKQLASATQKRHVSAKR